ncbi:MAG: threonylcarbamoyl-AMP synthase [Candidatus Portnoybacteria bacterium]|nr:threonylcarbamoyl-AMP synthase [Candidatus Portnoybacteria bacterium]
MIKSSKFTFRQGRSAAKAELQSSKLIIDILKQGGVVAAPTDTVYGLLADATNSEAVEKIYKIKGRKGEKALPIFLYSLDWLGEFVEIKPQQKSFLEKVWPGKVTVILKLKEKTSLAPNAISKEGSAAFRIPNHPLVIEILKEFKKPLTGTSANRSGMPPCLDAECIKKQLTQLKPDFIIDIGKLPPRKPSTIVDLTKTPPQIVRRGSDYKSVKKKSLS